METVNTQSPATAAPPKRRPSRRMAPVQIVRHTIQVLVAGYVLVVVIANTVSAAWAANLHTICPLGGVVNLYTYFSTGGYVAKLHSAVFIMLLALVIGLVLTGKSFCGWICPLGSIQEGLNGVGKRLWPRLYNRVPASAERILRYLKYLVLIWVLVQTARTAGLVFQDWDPYWNLYHIWTDEIALSGYLVAGLTIVASLFIPRPFSRYACPLGAINGFFNSFSLLGIKRDAHTCTDCGRCRSVCPVNIDPCATASVRNIECMRCMKCVEACPVNARSGGTLALRTWFHRPKTGDAGSRRPVSVWLFAGIAIAAFAVPIIVTNFTGDFGITKTRVYLTADDIKGSTSIEEIIENYAITEDQFYNGLGIPEGVSTSTKMKDLAAALGLADTGDEVISPALVREIVRNLDRLLSSLPAEAGVPEQLLANVLSRSGLPSTATLAQLLGEGPAGTGLYLFTGIGENGGGAGGGEGGGGVGDGAGDEQGTQTIKGSTTLGQIEDMVVDFPAFLEAFGIPDGEPSGATLGDLSGRYGFQMRAIRDYVAANAR